MSEPEALARLEALLERIQAMATELEGVDDAEQAVARLGELVELAREAQARIRRLGIYNATVKCFDGTLGWSAHGPYDAVLVAAGSPDIPEPLTAQLKVGGRLVLPVGPTRESQRLIRVIRREEGYETEEHESCAFVPLIGRYGWGE